MKALADKIIVDENGTLHHARSWDHDGHLVEVTSDEFGFHARIDEEPAIFNQDAEGIVGWVLRKLGIAPK